MEGGRSKIRTDSSISAKQENNNRKYSKWIKPKSKNVLKATALKSCFSCFSCFHLVREGGEWGELMTILGLPPSCVAPSPQRPARPPLSTGANTGPPPPI